MKKLLIFFIFVLLLWGCSKKSPTTVIVVQSRFIAAEITQQFGYVYEWVGVYSDPAPFLAGSSAYLKWAGDTFLIPQKKQTLKGIELSGNAFIPYPSTNCSLYVSTNLGDSRGGGVNMPGNYTIIEPAEHDTLPWGTVRVSWTPAVYATWYELRVYYLTDSTTLDTTLFLRDTTISFPESFFRRRPGITWAQVTLYLTAHGGAAAEPGAVGNMAGDFKGFFYSTYQDPRSNYYHFHVGSPKLDPMVGPLPRVTEERRRQAILRAFGIQDIGT